MKKCIHCGLEMARLEQNGPIRTYACTKCGLIENYFELGPLAAMLKNSKRTPEKEPGK